VLFAFVLSVVLLAIEPTGGSVLREQGVGSSPKLTVVVTKHQATGADLVEVTLLHPNYPAELLRSQILMLGQAVGSEPRGLDLFAPEPGPQAATSFVKASFGIDGLIRNETGEFVLEPIVRAFAGAPAPFTIDAMQVSFLGVAPRAGQTLMAYKTATVDVTGLEQQGMAGVEYRVSLLSQDASAISIPSRYEAPEALPASGAPDRRGARAWAFALAALGALSIGALVYCLAQRSRLNWVR